ncbi:hypothetical protein [Actinoplanes subglobosus]|uniref:Uncharacterized protein n=1 Tax=Actinoplanes subglobosus TaxID=1547892 RepID=A0ABV8JCB6_9ACTN
MRKQLRTGDVAIAPLPGGGFGACQVSGFDGESVVVHALDWFSPEPPRLDDLHGAGPAILRRHRFREPIAQTSVAPRYHPLPPDFTWLGNLPVPAGVPTDVNSISTWDWPLIAVVLDRAWADLPAEVRDAYRLSRGADPVTVDLGDGPRVETAALGVLDLASYPVGRPVDWSVLERLPRCTQIRWSGPDRGLTAALERHPLIGSLVWFDAPETVDLSRTRVVHLTIRGDALRELNLPPRFRNLAIDGIASARTVHAPDDGRWLHLNLFEATPATVAPTGLSQVRSLSIDGAGVLPAGVVTAFPQTHTLTLRRSSAPGRLDTPAALTELPGLRLLTMLDAYALDAETFPDLPLDNLVIDGLRASTARDLRTRFRRSPVTLRLSGAKADRWLATNMDNPFRDWSDDNTRAGAAACRAYATALRALDALPRLAPPPPTSAGQAAGARPSTSARETGSRPSTDAAAVAHPAIAAVEPVLRELVDKLNALDEKFDIIDTIRREEAGDAFMALAARAGIPTTLADEWFDTWRDF